MDPSPYINYISKIPKNRHQNQLIYIFPHSRLIVKSSIFTTYDYFYSGTLISIVSMKFSKLRKSYAHLQNGKVFKANLNSFSFLSKFFLIQSFPLEAIFNSSFIPLNIYL